MVFKLKLLPTKPSEGEVVLEPEKPLSGLQFIEEASRCLRRSLDGNCKCRHITLGTLATYTCTVPQAIAIESGWFDKENERTLIVDHNYLASYVFYGASMAYTGSRRSCYPYYENEIALTSFIDELAFLEKWKMKGYPEILTEKFNPGGNNPHHVLPIYQDSGDVDDPRMGDTILDILEQDCCNGRHMINL